jgi:mannose-6-phosphate isomerase
MAEREAVSGSRAWSRRDTASASVAPMALAPNQIKRFYRGGARIEALRGASLSDSGPEDWVGSTTPVFGSDDLGLSRLPDGRLLRDALQADPALFLGPEHVRRWGANPALLVKLLDAGERLAVHFHPGRAFAREVLGLGFGKTEAWVIVAADPDAVVYLGLKEELDPATLARWVREQDTAAMLSALHQLPVRAGQVLFVPAGTLHAIGAGILMVELQEPTDLSVTLESERFGIEDGTEHLGLGWERALAAVDRERASLDELVVYDGSQAWAGPVTELLPLAAEPYFRGQRIIVDDDPVALEPAFAILIVLEGRLTLLDERRHGLELARGATVLVPFAAGETTLSGQGTVIRCLTPSATAGAGRW